MPASTYARVPVRRYQRVHARSDTGKTNSDSVPACLNHHDQNGTLLLPCARHRAQDQMNLTMPCEVQHIVAVLINLDDHTYSRAKYAKIVTRITLK